MLLLDLQALAPFTDYFIIASCLNPRHMRAVAEAVEEAMDKAQVPVLHREGTPEAGWLLLDFGDIIVHLFTQPVRDHYGLDQLWSAAPTVLRVQ